MTMYQINFFHKICIVLAFSLAYNFCFSQNDYRTRTGHIHVVAYSKMMDVDANNYQVAGAFDPITGNIEFTALIKSFIFDLGMADRIINDERINVVEKPKVYYEGQITNLADIDLNTQGEYIIHVSGTLHIWGMTRITGARGTLEVLKDGTLKTSAKFKMTIEEESMNKVNDLMKEYLPSALSVDANKLGISRDIYIDTNMTLKEINRS